MVYTGNYQFKQTYVGDNTFPSRIFNIPQWLTRKNLDPVLAYGLGFGNHVGRERIPNP